MTTSSTQQAETVRPASILDWIEELRAVAKEAPWYDLVDFEGVDAIDVLLSPIYLSVLHALRGEAAVRKPTVKSLIDHARNLAYHAKMAIRERNAAQASATPGPTDVLMWSRDVTHRAIFRPVANALQETGASCRSLACQVGVYWDLREYDPHAVFTRGAWPEVSRAARRSGARRAGQLAAAGRWTIPPFANAAGIDMEPLARETVIKLLPLVSEAVTNARLALEEFGARLLVVGNDLTLEGRAGCRVAAQREIPTAMFMHGSIAGDAMQSLHCADRVLVCGTIHRQELVQQGVAPERIVICGAPNLDDRPRQTGATHARLQSRLGLGTRDPWVLVATSGPGHRISHKQHQVIIEQLAQLSNSLPHVPIVVKLHRKDRLSYYQDVLSGRPIDNLIIVATDARAFPRSIFQWLQGCSVVLTGASAVAVEAMLMDVPVVTMDFANEIQGVDFIDAGATTHVTTPESLLGTVGEVLAEGQPSDVTSRARAYIEDAFGTLDGGSAKRGAQSLLEMIGRHDGA